jgi:hypothetical protein
MKSVVAHKVDARYLLDDGIVGCMVIPNLTSPREKSPRDTLIIQIRIAQVLESIIS